MSDQRIVTISGEVGSPDLGAADYVGYIGASNLDSRLTAYLSNLDAISGWATSGYIGEDPSIAGWRDSLKKAAAKARAAVSKTVTQISKTANKVAQGVAKAAQKAGHSVTAAVQKGIAAANAAQKSAMHALLVNVQHTRQYLKDHLRLSPLQKFLAILVLTPPPANLVAALKFAQRHKDELVKSLPKRVRDSISEYEPDYLGKINITVPANVRQVWDHLPAGKRKEIVALLVVAVIVAVILAIYASGTVPAWVKTVEQYLRSKIDEFKKLGKDVIVQWLKSLFSRGASGVAEVPQAELALLNAVVPTPDDPLLDDAVKNEHNLDPEGISKTERRAALWSGGAMAALGTAAKFIGK